MSRRPLRIAVDVVYEDGQAQIVVMVLEERHLLPCRTEGLVFRVESNDVPSASLEGVKDALIQVIEHL